MPLQGILNTARTLSFYTRKQEVTANNIANASSDAFKADRVLARTVPGTDGRTVIPPSWASRVAMTSERLPPAAGSIEPVLVIG